MSRIRKLIPLLAVMLCVVGCAGEAQHIRIAYYSKYQTREAGHSPDQDAAIQRLCLFGEPRHAPGWPHGPTGEVIRPGYVLEHSSTDRIPLWVCEHLGSENLGGDLKRPTPDPFAPDPLLPTGARAELIDYRGKGYDRGHQAPSGDETKDAQRQRDTFYLSNMVPQVPQFNQHAWQVLEGMVRQWTAARGEAYVITGPMLYDPKEDDAKTATGFLRYSTIGDHVVVPTHLYKIVILKGKGGEWRAMAFVMQNQKYPPDVDYRTFIHSIRWIEDRTGINFMPELDKPGNEKLHKQLEEEVPTSVWASDGPE